MEPTHRLSLLREAIDGGILRDLENERSCRSRAACRGLSTDPDLPLRLMSKRRSGKTATGSELEEERGLKKRKQGGGGDAYSSRWCENRNGAEPVAQMGEARGSFVMTSFAIKL